MYSKGCLCILLHLRIEEFYSPIYIYRGIGKDCKMMDKCNLVNFFATPKDQNVAAVVSVGKCG